MAQRWRPPLALVPIYRLTSQAYVAQAKWSDAVAAAKAVVQLLEEANLGWHPLCGACSRCTNELVTA